MTPLLLTLIAFALVLIAAVAVWPSLAEDGGGRVLAIAALLGLPAIVTGGVADAQLEKSKSTEFCLSCHEMEPWGRSLWIADREHLPAVHFQDRLVPRDSACFTCHTDYALFGDVRAKMRGLQHLWAHFTSPPQGPEDIALYEPFENRECLHCHGGARAYLEVSDHEDVADDLVSGDVSCLDCHDAIHSVDELDQLERWTPPGAKTTAGKAAAKETP